jgi:hypothetical protein
MRNTVKPLLIGFGFAVALFAINAVYNSAFKHGHAECEAYYEDTESDWDA